MLAALIVLFSSCGGDPVKFNDTIIDGLIEVDNKLERINDFIYDSEYDDALAVLDSLQQHAVDCQKQFEALNYKSGEQFKQKSLDILKLVETEMIPGYKKAISEYKVADEIENEDEMNAAYDKIYESTILLLHEKYNILDDELIEIQKVFAKNNNMTLE